MADRHPRLESRVRCLERAVVLLASWAVEDRDAALAALTTSEIAYRGLLEGREGFAAAQCGAEALMAEFAARFAKNVRYRAGRRIDLARPERVKAQRRGR